MKMKKTKKKAIMIARKQTTNKIMFYRKETTMKKVIQILLICLIIAGTIVTATVGFNVGLKYSEHDEISINVGSKFNVADIKATAKEVFGNSNVLVRQVELYKDMVQITVKEATEEQITTLNDKINEKYGTSFTEMDKVLLQIENDYAVQDKWKSYAQNNDFKTFMLLFAKDFPEMAAARYEQNEDFFIKMFSEPVMMQQIMESVGNVVYERLKK